MQTSKILKELQEEKKRLEDEIGELESQDPSRSGFRDMNNTEDDDAAESENHSRIQALLEASRNQLDSVNKALVKIEDGSYGKCERCGKAIPQARLEARPTAIYDVECEEIMENGGR